MYGQKEAVFLSRFHIDDSSSLSLVEIRTAYAETLPYQTIIIDDGSLTIDHIVTVDSGNANNGFSAPYWSTSAGVKGYNNSSSKYTDAVGRTSPGIHAWKQGRQEYRSISWIGRIKQIVM